LFVILDEFSAKIVIMESIQVHQPFLDRAINFYQAADINEIKFDTKKLLQQAINTNENLKRIQKQLDEATLLNKQILQIQLNEEQNKFKQNFYKDLSFDLGEKTNLLQEIDDKVILVYFLRKYATNLKTELKNANEILHEIPDKIYNKTTIEKLVILEKSVVNDYSQFDNDELSKFDELLLDYENKKLEISKIAKPKYLIIQKVESLKYNLLGLILLSFVLLFTIFKIITDHRLSKDEISTLIIVIVPIIFLLHLRFSYDGSITKEQNKIDQNIKTKEKYENKIRLERENLILHNFNSAFTSINLKHQSFSDFYLKFEELTFGFQKKWGIK